jgi:hypothetical protein
LKYLSSFSPSSFTFCPYQLVLFSFFCHEPRKLPFRCLQMLKTLQHLQHYISYCVILLPYARLSFESRSQWSYVTAHKEIFLQPRPILKYYLSVPSRQWSISQHSRPESQELLNVMKQY